VHGGSLRKAKKAGAGAVDFNVLPMPSFATDLEQPWNILVTGIGGTGVVTIGALLGMAAHLEGKGSTVLDQTGLAQKGGAVTTPPARGARIRPPSTPCASRPAKPTWCSAATWWWSTITGHCPRSARERTNVVLNTYEAMPGTFTMQARHAVPGKPRSSMRYAPRWMAANRNWSMRPNWLPRCWATPSPPICSCSATPGSKGWVPISLDALMRAIELNGAAIEMNKTAFNWGRMGAHDVAAVKRAAGLGTPTLPTGAIPLNLPTVSGTHGQGGSGCGSTGRREPQHESG
jgi:indolepyruvate ferredoxin oxidoreductase